MIFPLFFDQVFKGWTRMNRVQSKRKKSAPFYALSPCFSAIFSAGFHQMGTKCTKLWKYEQTNCLVLVGTAPFSINTTYHLINAHPTLFSCHWKPVSFAPRAWLKKKNNKIFIKRWYDDNMTALTCSVITVAWRLVLFFCKRLAKAIFFPSPDRLKQIFRNS